MDTDSNNNYDHLPVEVQVAVLAAQQEATANMAQKVLSALDELKGAVATLIAQHGENDRRFKDMEDARKDNTRRIEKLEDRVSNFGWQVTATIFLAIGTGAVTILLSHFKQ